MNEEEMRRFIDLIKAHVWLRGRPTGFIEDGYDAYGVFHLRLDGEHDEIMLTIFKEPQNHS